MVRLGDVARIDRKSVQPNAIADGQAYLGLENIESGGRIINQGRVGAGELKSAKFAFDSRHVLYGKLRPNLAKVARPDFSGICSTDIVPLLTGPLLDRDYLAHFLLSPATVDWASSRTSGVNLPRLSPSVLEDLDIPLPSLDSQRRIASTLDAVGRIRSRRVESIAGLQHLHDELFDSMLGRASFSFPKKRVDQIAQTRLGKMLDAGKQHGHDHKRYLRNANVQWLNIDLSDLAEMEFSVKDQNEFALEAGDVLVCEGGQPGRSAVWNAPIGDIYFQKALHRVRLDRSIMRPEVFVRTMKAIVESGELSGEVSSATIAHLTGAKFKSVEVPIPPMELQLEYLERATEVDHLVELMKLHLAKVDEMLAALSRRAFGSR